MQPIRWPLLHLSVCRYLPETLEDLDLVDHLPETLEDLELVDHVVDHLPETLEDLDLVDHVVDHLPETLDDLDLVDHVALTLTSNFSRISIFFSIKKSAESAHAAELLNNLSVSIAYNLYTYKTLITLIVCLVGCLFVCLRPCVRILDTEWLF